jgi:multidrug transporter EmrE-like cation transporter
MGYIYLVLTILAETAAVLCMKLSNGFYHRWYTTAAILTYALGFVFLTIALKYLPAGIANGIWAGASTVLVAVFGVILFKEQLNTIPLISLFLIVIGLVGLNFSGGYAVK